METWALLGTIAFLPSAAWPNDEKNNEAAVNDIE